MTENPRGLLGKLAEVTKMVRESLRELGLEPPIQVAAEAIPDVQSRLRYISQLTSQAACTALDNTEESQAIIKDLRQYVMMAKMGDQEAIQLLIEQSELAFPKLETAMQNIVVAQGFQDLTGQVIHKLTTLVGKIETELVSVLVQLFEQSGGMLKNIDAAPVEATLLNGPAIEPSPASLGSQDDVDAFLKSMGL